MTSRYDTWRCTDPRDAELGPDPRRDRADAPWLRKGPMYEVRELCAECGRYTCPDGCQETA